MTPIEISGANRTFGTPTGWDETRDGRCEALAVRYTNGLLESAWKPSPEELAALNAGAPVILTIWGSRHPLVSVNVEMPLTSHNHGVKS